MFDYKFTLLYIMLSKTIITDVSPSIVVLDKGIYPIETESIGVQFYVDVENDHHWGACRIHSWPKMCCLEDEPFKDCSTETSYGDNIEAILPKRRETLIYVYPTLYQHDQVGYCDFVLDFKCNHDTQPKSVQVSIPFNTKMNNKNVPDYLEKYKEQKKRSCPSLDEDSLNNCLPVECDLKYSGRRPFYDETRSKCVSAPACDSNLSKELPDVAYVPQINICRDLEQSITLQDVFDISTGVGVVTKPINRRVTAYNVELQSNCTTISQNLVLLKDLLSGKLCPLFGGDSGYSKCYKNALLSIFACISLVSGVLLLLICGIYMTNIFYSKWSNGELKNVYGTWKFKVANEKVNEKPSQLNKNVTSNLLKEVIVRELPVELRDSVLDLCDRIDAEVKQKKRYRMRDLGSQVNFKETVSTSSLSSGRSYDDEDSYHF